MTVMFLTPHMERMMMIKEKIYILWQSDDKLGMVRIIMISGEIMKNFDKRCEGKQFKSIQTPTITLKHTRALNSLHVLVLDYLFYQIYKPLIIHGSNRLHKPSLANNLFGQNQNSFMHCDKFNRICDRVKICVIVKRTREKVMINKQMKYDEGNGFIS